MDLIDIPPFNRLDPEKLAKIGEQIFMRDYSSSAITFLENPSRTLHYWSGEPNILPFGDEGGKRRKYSFFDMIWLLIVNELRGFGLEKTAIFNLKEQLLTPIDVEQMIKHLYDDRDGMEEFLKQRYQISQKEVTLLFEELIGKKKEMLELQATKLFAYSMMSIGEKVVVRLLINKEGKYVHYPESQLPGLYHMERDEPWLGNSYMVLHLTNLITELLAIEPIKDSFKEAFFTVQEWKLLKFLKGEKPVSVKVTYKGEQMDLLEISRRKKIKVEARLSEILLKNAYEKIVVENIKGNVVECISTEKIKLDK